MIKILMKSPHLASSVWNVTAQNNNMDTTSYPRAQIYTTLIVKYTSFGIATCRGS